MRHSQPASRRRVNPEKPRGRREPRPLRRLLHLADGSVWSWQVNRCEVVIQSPTGQKWRIWQIDLLNDAGGYYTPWTWDSLERSHHKGWGFTERSITPARVRDYLLRHLLPLSLRSGVA